MKTSAEDELDRLVREQKKAALIPMISVLVIVVLGCISYFFIYPQTSTSEAEFQEGLKRTRDREPRASLGELDKYTGRARTEAELKTRELDLKQRELDLKQRELELSEKR